MRPIIPRRPGRARSLLTLQFADKMNKRKPGTVTQEIIDAATAKLVETGVSTSRIRGALVKGGMSQTAADAQLAAHGRGKKPASPPGPPNP